MVCRDFILPEPASYVFFYAFSNLRNLLYIISNSCLYVCAHRTTMPIASAFVYFLVIKISFLKQQKKRRLRHRSVTRLLFMTGFSVVRRRSVPSGQRPFYCIYIGFFCCPPTLRPKVRHLFRILGASRTRGMTPSIHFYYM